MKAIYLSSVHFQKVLGQEQTTITHILTDYITPGEKVAVIEGRENCPTHRSIKVFRYITDVLDSEFITDDEIIATITLSALAPTL